MKMFESFGFGRKPENNESEPFIYEGYGETIEEVTKEMVKISKNRDVVCDFNGIELKVEKGSDITPEELESIFLEKQNNRMVEYLNSPEYQEKKKKEAEEIAAKQAEMDVLLAELPNMDFNNQEALLDWLCKYESNAWKSVKSDQYNVVHIFNQNGYKISTSSLDKRSLEDKDKSARHIIEQALWGISEMGAPHQIISHHVEGWKKKFSTSS